jgi:predicted DNA-binding transcriptional regulator YafY
MNKKNWFQQARLQAIETLSYWRGHINTTDIIKQFGISRVAALGDLRRYTQLAPGNLVYSATEKAFIATSIFKHQLTRGSIDEWMAIEPQFSEHVAKPQFDILPEIARPLIDAIDAKTGTSIHYRSMEHPGGTERVIFPHKIVYSGFRWHIRAWCDRRKDFRDFNLSRISSVVATNRPQPAEAEEDRDVAWTTMVTIKLCANPELEDRERSLIETEYGMSKGVLNVESRAAMLEYTLQAYQIGMSAHGYKSRLTIANPEEIADYRW